MPLTDKGFLLYGHLGTVMGNGYDNATMPCFTYGYGANGQAAYVRDSELNRTVWTEYDTSERSMRVHVLEGATSSSVDTSKYINEVKYDQFGNVKEISEQINNQGRTRNTHYSYDDENRVTEVTCDEDNRIIAYTYDAIGRVATRAANSMQTSYLTTYQYLATENGDSIQTTPLVQSITQNGQNFSYTYDNVGNITSVTRNGLTTTYEYDSLGQLTRDNDPHAGKSTMYLYDCGGNMTGYLSAPYTLAPTLEGVNETVFYTYGDSNWKPFRNHPFKVRDDQRMLDTVDSIREYGVLVPAIARPDPEGGYELISGHRRKHGCEMAGLQTMPVIIRDLDDDAAVLVMVDSNIQREELLPSERAFAYQMKLEALKHQGARMDLTSCQVGTKLRADEKLAESVNESARTVQRFIRLTELISELLDMVDERKLAFNPAVEVSYLKRDEQRMLLEAMDAEQTTPSLSQAQRLKKFSQEGRLTEEAMSAIMSEEKKSDMDKVTLRSDTLRRYFPKSYTPKQMEQTIIRLLDVWQKQRQKNQER